MLGEEYGKLKQNVNEPEGRDTAMEKNNSDLEKETEELKKVDAIFEGNDDKSENCEESEKNGLGEIIQLVCTILDEISIDLEDKRKRILYLTAQREEHNKILKKLEEAEDVAGGYFLPEVLNSNKKEQAVFRSEMDEIENLLFVVKEEEKLREERRRKLRQLLRYLRMQENNIESEKAESGDKIEDTYQKTNKLQNAFELQESEEKVRNSKMNYSAVQIFSSIVHKIEFVNQLMGLDGMRAKIELLEIEEILKKAMGEWESET